MHATVMICVVPCFHSQFFLFSEWCSIYRILSYQTMPCGRLQEVKNDGKVLNYQPQKVVMATTGEGLLGGVPAARL